MRSFAQLAVRLSNERGVQEVVLLKLTYPSNVPPKSTNYTGKTCCQIIKPGRHAKTSTRSHNRPFTDPMHLGALLPDLVCVHR